MNFYALLYRPAKIIFLGSSAPLDDRVERGEKRRRQEDEEEDAEVEPPAAFEAVVGEEKGDAEEDPKGGVEMQQKTPNLGRRVEELVVADLELEALFARRRVGRRRFWVEAVKAR